jgi:hypothetical protein
MIDNFENTQSDDASLSDFAVKRAAFERLQAELQSANKAALCDALAVAGITNVTVSFDGYGDDGQIESIEANAGENTVAWPDVKIDIARAKWGQAEPLRSTLDVHDAIEQLTYDLLTDTHDHDGWENNEGAYGEFAFDVATRTITLDFNCRFVESEHSQHIF